MSTLITRGLGSELLMADPLIIIRRLGDNIVGEVKTNDAIQAVVILEDPPIATVEMNNTISGSVHFSDEIFGIINLGQVIYGTIQKQE